MSKEKLQKGTGSPKRTIADQKASDRQTLALTINKATNEIIFTDPSGQVFVIEPKVIEPEQQKIEYKPLTPGEFRDALDQLHDLGIKWTTTIPPSPMVENAAQWNDSAQRKYLEIQKKYVRFPSELGNVILHAILGRDMPAALVGSEAELKQKAAIVESRILNQEYRSEFFFKYAIKVPYVEQLDWEIVVKAYEKNVRSMPRVAYALLSLALRNPINITLPLERGAPEDRETQLVAVALNEKLIDRLLEELGVIKKHLEKAQESALLLAEQDTQKVVTNESNS